MACLGVVGLGGVLLMASSNTLMQSMVDEDKRGRAMSIFTMSFTGTMPIGNLIVGALAGVVGPSMTFMVSGLICIAVAIVFYRLLPQLRAAAAPLLARLNLIETG
jgi:predicted MFS family arabinose efflux permease